LKKANSMRNHRRTNATIKKDNGAFTSFFTISLSSEQYELVTIAALKSETTRSGIIRGYIEEHRKALMKLKEAV